MAPIHTNDLEWLWTLVAYAVWSLSNSHTSGNVACIIYDMFILLLQDVSYSCEAVDKISSLFSW